MRQCTLQGNLKKPRNFSVGCIRRRQKTQHPGGSDDQAHERLVRCSEKQTRKTREMIPNEKRQTHHHRPYETTHKRQQNKRKRTDTNAQPTGSHFNLARAQTMAAGRMKGRTIPSIRTHAIAHSLTHSLTRKRNASERLSSSSQ